MTKSKCDCGLHGSTKHNVSEHGTQWLWIEDPQELHEYDRAIYKIDKLLKKDEAVYGRLAWPVRCKEPYHLPFHKCAKYQGESCGKL